MKLLKSREIETKTADDISAKECAERIAFSYGIDLPSQMEFAWTDQMLNPVEARLLVVLLAHTRGGSAKALAHRADASLAEIELAIASPALQSILLDQEYCGEVYYTVRDLTFNELNDLVRKEEQMFASAAARREKAHAEEDLYIHISVQSQ